MKRPLTLLGAALCAAALAAGCDRSERGPVKSAAQPPAPSAAPSAGASRPLPSQQPPQADATTKQEPPVQGQADAREQEQKQHFDNKS
jgi:hypothetical protein